MMHISRVRLTCAAAMGVIAILALIFNHFRPIGREEAIKVALVYLKANYPSGQWSSSSVSAVVSPMGRMWVVSIPDGKFGDPEEHFFDNVAVVLVHFDGRCFRQGVYFGGLGGSLDGHVDPSTGEWVVNYDYGTPEMDTDTLFKIMMTRRRR